VVSEWKTKANAVDAERRRIREDLDALKDDVRAPLDAWEHKDQTRRAAHENALVAMRALSQFSTFQPTSEIDPQRLAELAPYAERNWEEFSGRAASIINAVGQDLAQALAAAEKREAEQAERDRLSA
jgi:colicin import membrane protein